MFPTQNIHTVPRDLRDSAPVSRCENPMCRGEIFSGETVYRWEGRWLCPDCFKAAVELLLESDPRQLALELNLDMQRYE